MVREKNSTVRFVVQHIDSAEDNFPSFQDISKAHFLSLTLGDINVISNSPMTCGSKPEADPDNSPIVFSIRANFIPGGLILNTQLHHWINGLSGSTGFHRQLAANCYAIANNTELPFFDRKWLDRSLYGIPGFDRSSTLKESQVEAPPRADRNLKQKPSHSMLFHLRKSKAVELRNAALPSDGSRISTFDAICALMWRVTSKIRQPLYKADLASKPTWGQGVGIHKAFTDPPLPTLLQGNLQMDISSATCTIPPPTLADVISEMPLSQLARYTRQVTDSVTADMLFDRLEKLSRVRNQRDLSIRVDSLPPMSLLCTDWRSAVLCSFDFGFGKASAWRHLFGGVALSNVCVYGPRKGPAGDDEGVEILLPLEIELSQKILSDPLWNEYFEFRGIDDSEDEVASTKPLQSKL